MIIHLIIHVCILLSDVISLFFCGYKNLLFSYRRKDYFLYFFTTKLTKEYRTANVLQVTIFCSIRTTKVCFEKNVFLCLIKTIVNNGQYSPAGIAPGRVQNEYFQKLYIRGKEFGGREMKSLSSFSYLYLIHKAIIYKIFSFFVFMKKQ